MLEIKKWSKEEDLWKYVCYTSSSTLTAPRYFLCRLCLHFDVIWM